MEEILTSTKGHITVVTAYLEEDKKFITLSINTETGSKSILEYFTDIEELVATHDFWCKLVGIIPAPFKKTEVNLHSKQIHTA